MRFNSFDEAFDDLHNDTVEQVLREDAERQGIPWSDYCYKYGIVGAAQQRRVRRHEVSSYEEMAETQEHYSVKEEDAE